MAHNHENCLAPQWGVVCTSGHVTGYCSDEYPDADWACDNEYCADYGHCRCLCHSGKTCGCGYSWPRMYKRSCA
jgi:hypothetical protein